MMKLNNKYEVENMKTARIDFSDMSGYVTDVDLTEPTAVDIAVLTHGFWSSEDIQRPVLYLEAY